MRLSAVRWASTASRPRLEQPATRLPPRSAHDKRRRHVINPVLCHEALELLKPGLPAPGSCDVVDIYPGAAVWSKALHQVLKPRRHVFVERDQGAHTKSIEPLLQDEDSPYRLTDLLKNAFDPKQDLLSERLRASYLKSKPEKRTRMRAQETKELILTANLSGKFARSAVFQGPISQYFMYLFYGALCANQGESPFNTYGLVKLLAWIPENAKYPIVPRGAGMRFRLSKLLEASCDIREIVSSSPNTTLTSMYKPWYGADVESRKRALQRQRESDIEIPDHRQQPAIEPPSVFYEPVPDNFAKLLALKDKPPLVTEYIQAYNELPETDTQGYREWKAKAVPGKNSKGAQTDDLKCLARLETRIYTKHRQYLKVDDLAHQQIDLEEKLMATRERRPSDVKAYETQLARYKDRLQSIKEQHSVMYKDNFIAYKKALDDYRLLLSTRHVKPALAWNNRPHEPLHGKTRHDFASQNTMTLIEVTPKPSFQRLINTQLRQICFDYVVGELSANRNLNVQQGLEGLLGTSSDSDVFREFVAGVPQLTDPLYGGYHDLTDVRLRTMRAETWVTLALAYEAWPFRKDEARMLEKADSGLS